MKNKYLILSAIAGLFLLGGCSNAKEQLGLTKSAPDEFMVVKRAPLAMPPDYNLNPPQPGAPRPQELATDQAAKTTVFGEIGQQGNVEATNSDDLLLQQAGATQAQDGIRQVVDSETADMADRNKSVTDKLIGWGKDEKPSATVVNAKQELERLKENEAEGKPLTEGETPSIEE